jgi:hypothetical protein
VIQKIVPGIPIAPANLDSIQRVALGADVEQDRFPRTVGQRPVHRRQILYDDWYIVFLDARTLLNHRIDDFCPALLVEGGCFNSAKLMTRDANGIDDFLSGIDGRKLSCGQSDCRARCSRC